MNNTGKKKVLRNAVQPETKLKIRSKVKKKVHVRTASVKKIKAQKKPQSKDLDALKRAFDVFSETTTRLERAYTELQKKVSELNIELEKKNIELSTNLRELDSIKTHLEYILESIKMGVVEVDRSGVVTVFNRAAEEITGYSRDLIIGRQYNKIFSTKGAEHLSLMHTLKTMKEYHYDEKEITAADGTVIPVEFSTSIVKNDHGESLGVVEMFSDLRDIKKLEEEVQKVRTLAALGEMAANVAHEIRNPLGGIGGFAALLERDIPMGDPRRNLVAKIIDGVASLNRIALNLLFFTRPLKPKLRRENIVHVVDDVLSLVEVELAQEKKEITIIKQFPEDEIEVRIDPDLIQQVMINLLKNASQAIEKHGELLVEVKAVDSGRTVEISVKDTGKGMSPEIQKKLFNPFFTTRADGTGLGLANVKKIIDVHKGTIVLESNVGKGTTFRINLPC